MEDADVSAVSGGNVGVVRTLLAVMDSLQKQATTQVCLALHAHSPSPSVWGKKGRCSWCARRHGPSQMDARKLGDISKRLSALLIKLNANTLSDAVCVKLQHICNGAPPSRASTEKGCVD